MLRQIFPATRRPATEMAPDASHTILAAPRIDVRAPGEHDQAGLIALINDLAAEANALFILPVEGDAGAANLRAHLAAAARSGDEAILVAACRGRIAGLATATRGIHPAKRGSAEIGIGVAPGQRRRGIGRALMTEIDRWAPGAGIHRLHLTVVATNAPAIALYRALGYAPEGVLRASARIGGALVDELVMAKLI